jgi:hypothetical protein
MSLLRSDQFFEMQSALEHYNEHGTTLKMTTGSAELDSLIDAIHFVKVGIGYPGKAIMSELISSVRIPKLLIEKELGDT